MTHGEFDTYDCSFCGKSQKQVRKMIAGPNVAICDECVDLCVEIIEEDLLNRPLPPKHVPKDRGGFG